MHGPGSNPRFAISCYTDGKLTYRKEKNNYKVKNYSMQNKFSNILMDFSVKGMIIYQVIFLNLIEEEKQSSNWLLKSIVKVTLCL